jgi:hypothetical protein
MWLDVPRADFYFFEVQGRRQVHGLDSVVVVTTSDYGIRASTPLLPKSDTLKFHFFIWRALQLKEGHSYTPNVPLK